MVNKADIEPLIGLYDYLEDLYKESKDPEIKKEMKNISKELKEKFNVTYPRDTIEERNISKTNDYTEEINLKTGRWIKSGILK